MQSPTTLEDRAAATDEQIERGRQRLARWQDKGVLNDPDVLAQRLAAEGLSEDEFLACLGAPEAPAPEADVARRIQFLRHLLAEMDKTAATGAEKKAAATVEQLLADAPELGLLQPLLVWGCELFAARTAELYNRFDGAPFAPDTLRDLLRPALVGRLQKLLRPSLVLHVNVERMLGNLRGETPEARYRYCLQELAKPHNAQAFFVEYPLLADQAVRCVEQWIGVHVEFLERLCIDWPDLLTAFAVGDPGPLAELTTGAGDPHRGGRTVMIARFAAGFRLVYKPRSMTVDRHFQELLAWLNRTVQRELPLRTLAVLGRDGYGWMEFVEGAPCQSEAELRRYYARLGALTALLFVLRATDFHAENIIAAGEQPMLVDLESIFQPDVRRDAAAMAPSQRLLEQSVVRIGILPRRIWRSEDGNGGVDMSGMSATEDVTLPFKTVHLEAEQTDQVHIVRRPSKLGALPNVPVARGAQLRLSDYITELTHGFESVYRACWKARTRLLAPGGLLARFADDEVRVILRPTVQYAMLLGGSRHPHMVRDVRERDLLFDQLWNGVQEQPHYAALVGAEQDALRRGDVPFFTTTPGSRLLTDGAGVCDPAYLDESEMDALAERLAQMSEADLARQLWFVRASIAAASLPYDQPRRIRRVLHEPAEPPSAEELLRLAVSVGDQLLALALEDDAAIGWLGINLTAEQLELGPVGVGLYDGLAGIALFLAYLGRESAEPRYTAAARKIVATIDATLEREPTLLHTVGAFVGRSSVLYAYIHLAALLDDGTLLEKAVSFLPALAQQIDEDWYHDVMSGAAGAILVLDALWAVRPHDDVIDLIDRCAKRLVHQALPMEKGLGWSGQSPPKPLSGFSHGAAGIALALQVAAARTGNAAYAEAAQKALVYERSLFDRAVNNWRDLRRADENRCMTAWCNGAVGIGLARLAMLRFQDEPVIRREIEAALRTTLDHGAGYNHSLCHGDLGNVELLLVANEMYEQSDVAAALRDFVAQSLAGVDDHGWRSGIPDEVETPGLMQGLAGVGYQLLRLADPKQVPSVLLLEPPRR